MTESPVRSATTASGGGDPADLSNDDIALLSDIGGTAPIGDDEAGVARITRLIAQGYLKRDAEGASKEANGLRLTRKAQDLLSSRGAGLNES